MSHIDTQGGGASAGSKIRAETDVALTCGRGTLGLGRWPIRLGTATAACCMLLAHASSHAIPDQIACAAEIHTPSITVKAHNGWVPFIPFPLKLYSAGMSAGAPETLTILRGEPQPSKKGVYKTRYGFPADGEKWLDCTYGDGGEIQLSRRLDDSVTQCLITLMPAVPAESRRVTVVCQ